MVNFLMKHEFKVISRSTWVSKTKSYLNKSVLVLDCLLSVLYIYIARQLSTSFGAMGYCEFKKVTQIDLVDHENITHKSTTQYRHTYS